MRRRTLLAAASGAALGGLAGCLSDSCPPRSDPTEPPDGWPMAGFDAANTGSAGSITPPAGEPVWQFHTDDDARGAASTPVVDDERVFVVAGLPARFAEGGGRLYALERATGEVDWDYELPGGAGGGPALVGDAVLVGSGDGTLLALERATGDVHWRTDLGGAVRTPAVADGWCYVQTGTGRVSAVDVETGEGCWDARIAGALDRLGFGSDYDTHAEGRPAVAEDTVYVTTGEREDDESSTEKAIVRAIERESGDDRWTKSFATRRRPRSPVVADGAVYAACEDRVIALADGRSGTADPGEELWTFVTGYEVTSAPAVVDDTAYVGAKNVYAIDLETGRERWRHVNEAPANLVFRSGGDRVAMTGHPIVGEDAVYVGAGALDLETGDRRWGEVGNREDSDYFSGIAMDELSPGGVAVTDDALYVSTTHGIVTKVGADA